jgi:hypothetical protein
MKLNLKLQNIFLVIVFAAVVVTCVIYDNYYYAVNPASIPSATLYFTAFDAWKIVYIFVAAAAAAAFLWVAIRYNKNRQQKADKYLSSLIFYTAIYQGIAYIFHVVQILITGINSLGGVTFKLYMPLGIVALMFFAFMAMEVFMKPAVGQSGEHRLEILIVVLLIAGTAIGIIILLFSYIPDGDPFEITMGAIGFSVFGLILIIVGVVISKMLKLLRSISEPIQVLALKAIALQLILLGLETFFMVLVEMAAFIKMTDDVAYFFRITQSIISIVIAWLYYPAFINPSENKSTV